MSMPRERDRQARELNELLAVNRQVMAEIISSAIIPDFCLDCNHFSDDCAAGIATEIKSDAQEFEVLKDLDRRRLSREVRLLPAILRIADDCVELVEEYGRPKDIDFEEMLENSQTVA